MTLEDIREYFESIPVEQTAEIADAIFDAIEAGHTSEEVAEINSILLSEGIDVTVKCRKKHPTS